MKKSLSIAVLAAIVGLSIGVGAAIATGGAPTVHGIWGWGQGVPMHLVKLQDSSGLYVPLCSNGQRVNGNAMANGGYVVYCK